MVTQSKRTVGRPRTAGANSNESGERESAGFRAALPSLEAPAPSPTSEAERELETRIFALVTAVSNNDGMTFPPEWLTVADAAKRRGLLNENNLRLFLTDMGRQSLALRAAPSAGKLQYTMTKIDPRTRLALKDLARETGIPMQEAISHIVDALHSNRDALTRAARRNGQTYPWEAIGRLVKGQ